MLNYRSDFICSSKNEYNCFVKYDKLSCGGTKKWSKSEVETKFLILLPFSAAISLLDVVLDIYVICSGYDQWNESAGNNGITILLVTFHQKIYASRRTSLDKN